MKKILLSFILGLVASLNLVGQTCLNTGIVFHTQAEIDSFPYNYPGCSHILGNVTIEIPFPAGTVNLEGLSQIVQIDSSLSFTGDCPTFQGLHNLESIGGNLVISSRNDEVSTAALSKLGYLGGDLELYNTKDVLGFLQLDTIFGQLTVRGKNVENLEGLNNLKHIAKYLWISDCDALASLSGLQNLATIEEGFYLFGRPFCPLNSLEHLSSLQSVGGRLAIESFPNLKTLNGLIALEQLGGFSTSFSSFESLDGLQGITETATVKINSSPRLNSLLGLENITRIGLLSISGCDSLLNLSGLTALEKVDDFLVYYNDGLQTLEGVEKLDTITNDLRIHGNPIFESFVGLTVKEISGKILLRDLPAIKDFSTLCCLDNFEGLLSVQASGITSLAGLENIKKLSTLRLIYNEELQTLAGIENLATLNYLYLFNNNLLSDIDALAATDPAAFASNDNPSITINDNPLLSNCNIASICAALERPEVTSFIENNLTICNSKASILSQCLTSTTDENLSLSIPKAYPNPFAEVLWVESKTAQFVSLLNSTGIVNERYELREGITELVVTHLPAGIYFLKTDNGTVIKVIKN